MSFNPIRYPKSGVISPQRGLNLADNQFDVRPDEAMVLQNMLFVRDSLLQRRPFRAYSTTDFVADGAYRGAHDYKYPGGAARLLWYTNGGKIRERLTSSTEADRVTGLSTGLEGYFSTVFDSVVFTNGSNAPQVGRDTSWRQFGSPAAVANLAVSPSGVGSFTGDFLHIVIAVIEVAGVGAVFANWSNIIKSSPSGNAQFGLTWTDVVDSRVTAYYVYRTTTNGAVLYSVARVATGVGAYTDTTADSALPATVSGAPAIAPARNAWGVPPVARLVAFSGNRVVLGNIPSGNLQNAIQLSQVADTSYRAEGFPADGSTLVRMLRDGDLTCVFPIGETGEGSARANNLFIAQESACYILPETNPQLPLQEISGAVGCIGQRAIAQDGQYLFFQSRRGVEFWPGTGREIYLLSDKIQPAFTGGGNQQLAANQSDGDIRYTIAKNQLWITIRDDADAACPNKAWTLDLLRFRRTLNPLNPALSARFTGPQVNEGLGFGLLLRRLDGTLVNFDTQNSRILFYDESGSQDQIDGVDTDMPVVIEQGPILREDPLAQKTLHYAHVLQFTNSEATLRMKGEFERVLGIAVAEPNTYALEWEDISWTDMEWVFDTWYSETPFDYGAVVGKWFVPRVEKEDSEASFAYFGLVVWFSAFSIIRNYR